MFLMSEVPLYTTCVTCGCGHAPPLGPTVGLVLGASDHPDEKKGVLKWYLAPLPLGPCSRTMPRALQWSSGGGSFL